MLSLSLVCWVLTMPSEKAEVPGSIIAHSPKSSRIYLGSPGITILSNGDYLAKHDEFGPGSTESTNAITKVYRSKDKGKTWTFLSQVSELFWANIFEHRDSVYMMGTTAGHRHGYCVIRKSVDGGKTWSPATGSTSGRLFPSLSYHTAPMPIVIHKGRIWRAMEDEKGGTQWGKMFRAFVMSAPVDSDLLDASSWMATNALGFDPSYLEGQFGGWLEGNIVVGPDGALVNILRADYREGTEKAALLQISSDGKAASFNPKDGFINFPGGCKKFVIRRDPKEKRYWSLSNAILPQYAGGNVERTRNTIVLLSSSDLRKWTPHRILLHTDDVKTSGFQYLDWQFDGRDIIAASRTAFEDGVGGADNQHNANFITFHRFRDFRSALKETVKIAQD